MLSRYMGEILQAKLFITGRPPITEVSKLHDVEPSLVDSDIEQFFRARMADIAKIRSDCNLQVQKIGRVPMISMFLAIFL